jgi:hypothetical protein
MAKVKELINNIKLGVYNIPEFQRSFVWTPQQVRDLVESIWRQYPIGVIIEWRGENVPRSGEGSPITSWIIDGQQRLTSLCILHGLKPPWWENTESWEKTLKKYNIMVKVNYDLNDLEFAVSNPVREKEIEWVSVRQLVKLSDDELSDLAGKIAEVYVRKLPEALRDEMYGKTRDKIRDRLRDLQDKLQEYDLVILPSTHEIDDVVEIFTRINTTGTKVREADIMVALLSIKNRGWIKEEFLPYITNIQEEFGFDLDPGIIIKMLAGITPKRSTRMREIGEKFWTEEMELNKYWKKLKDSLTLVCRLMNDHGVLSSELLVSKYVLIPLVALYDKFKERVNPKRALFWFILATWDGRYSGASDTILGQDLKVIDKSPTFEDAINELRSKLEVPEKIYETDVLKDYRRDRFMRFLLYLTIFNNGALDWRQKVRIGYVSSNTPFSDFRPQWHHFFPRNVLRKYNEEIDDSEKLNEEEINSLANITILNPNQKAFRTEPSDYIKRFNIPNELLEQQYIPTGDEKLWKVENYRDFLHKRAELMVDGINRFLNSLRSEVL